MKKFLLALLLTLSISAEACPPPTGHLIIDGALTCILPERYYSEKFPSNNIGGTAFIGYETPRRWSTIGIQYTGIDIGEHSIGLEHKLNLVPMWLNSIVNLHLLTGVGYTRKPIITDNIYATAGLEIEFGYLQSIFSFFIRDEIGFDTPIQSFEPQLRNYVSAGIHFWLGKDW